MASLIETTPVVILVQPRASAEPAYPLALAAISASLKQLGFAVVGADLHFDSVAELVIRASQAGDVMWIGSTCLPHKSADVGSTLAELRKVFPSARTLVVGALPTLDAERAKRETGADFAIGGPPESAVADLIEGRPARIVPMRDLPMPDRSLFPIERYSHGVRAVEKPYAAIVTSRGCGLGCAYCPVDSLNPGGLDARTVEQVYEEMASLARDYGVRSIHVEDDNFLRHPVRVRALCELLRKKPLPVIWELMNGVRPDAADPSLFAAMGEAKCRRVVFSFEHLAARHPGDVGYADSVAREAVATARSAGMRVGGYFMVGLPGTGLVETLDSLRRALMLGLDYAKFTPYWFAPGSPWGREKDRLESTCLPPRVVRNLCRTAEFAFLSQPRPFARMALDIAADPELVRVLSARALELLRRGGPVPMRD